MRETWLKVRKVLVAEVDAAKAISAAQASKPPRKLQPRDLPRDWKPTPIDPTPKSSTTSTPVPAPGYVAATDPSKIVNAVNVTPDEMLDGLRRVLAQASGRSYP